MIEIEGVRPTARELRVITGGWGALHWAAALPIVAFPIGFLVFGLLALGPDGDRFPRSLLFLAFLATAAAWMIANAVARDIAVRAVRSSPVGDVAWRWRIDADGFAFDNALQRNQLDWRAVKAVREEKDRFLFLVTPIFNPVLPKRLLTETQTRDLRALIAQAKADGRLGAGETG